MAPCVTVMNTQDSLSSSGFCLAMASLTRSQKDSVMDRPGVRGAHLMDDLVDLCSSTSNSSSSSPSENNDQPLMFETASVVIADLPTDPPTLAVSTENDDHGRSEKEDHEEPIESSQSPTIMPAKAVKVEKKQQIVKPASIGSFFCKAKPKNVIKLVNEAVNSQPKSERGQPRRTLKSSGAIKGLESRLQAAQNNITSTTPSAIVVVQPVEPKIEPISLISTANEDNNDATREMTPEDLSEEIKRQISERQAQIQKQKSYYTDLVNECRRITTTAKQSLKMDPDDDDDDQDEDDPELKAALEAARKSSSQQSQQKLEHAWVTIKIVEFLTLAALKSDPKTQPSLNHKVSTASTVGTLRKLHCEKRHLSPKSLLLTYRDVPLYDSVPLGLALPHLVQTQAGAKIELILYDKTVLDQVRLEREKVKEATFEMINAPVVLSNFDVSALMNDETETGEVSSASGLRITVKVGRADGHTITVQPVYRYKFMPCTMNYVCI